MNTRNIITGLIVVMLSSIPTVASSNSIEPEQKVMMVCLEKNNPIHQSLYEFYKPSSLIREDCDFSRTPYSEFLGTRMVMACPAEWLPAETQTIIYNIVKQKIANDEVVQSYLDLHRVCPIKNNE